MLLSGRSVPRSPGPRASVAASMPLVSQCKGSGVSPPLAPELLRNQVETSRKRSQK